MQKNQSDTEDNHKVAIQGMGEVPASVEFVLERDTVVVNYASGSAAM